MAKQPVTSWLGDLAWPEGPERVGTATQAHSTARATVGLVAAQ